MRVTKIVLFPLTWLNLKCILAIVIQMGMSYLTLLGPTGSKRTVPYADLQYKNEMQIKKKILKVFTFPDSENSPDKDNSSYDRLRNWVHTYDILNDFFLILGSTWTIGILWNYCILQRQIFSENTLKNLWVYIKKRQNTFY